MAGSGTAFPDGRTESETSVGDAAQCARLRYSSEGGYLRGSGRGVLGAVFRAHGNLPRPKSWLPYVFTSIDDPRLDEIIGARLCPI